MAETFALNADIQQLLSWIIYTCHSNKDDFLREIVSNAPDALEKIRYEFITDPEKVKEQPNSFIKIVPDKTNSTITIEDNGIGMTENEFINNLGTWLGFYSTYFVSDEVRAASKHNDDENNKGVTDPGDEARM